ncbi:MAG: SDR family NAD(P)-dependent oxidoreductase [Longimicrobiales bacterium]
MSRSTDRLVAITGANRGIGFHLAQRLAARDFRILLLCRDRAAGREAVNQLPGGDRHSVVTVDLSSWESVGAAAEEVTNRGDPLAALVNNAAVLPPDLQRNAQGIELQLAVNHLGHVLLTRLLMPMLQHGTSSDPPRRVVTVSSGSHYGPPVDLEDTGWVRRPYKRLQAYQQSKLANVAFTLALARRLEGTGVEATALQPGTYDTGLWADYIGLGRLSGLVVPSPERAAPVVARLVDPNEPGAPQGSVNGVYFKRGQEARPADAALDPVHQEALWRWSLTAVGLN